MSRRSSLSAGDRRSCYLVLAALLLDVGGRCWAVSNLRRGGRLSLFPGLELTHVLNTGVVFGLLPGVTSRPWSLGSLLGGSCGGLVLACLSRSGELAGAIRIGVVAGGGINLVDRLARGGVVDYIGVGWNSCRLVFNLADLGICGGLMSLLLRRLGESSSVLSSLWPVGGAVRRRAGSARISDLADLPPPVCCVRSSGRSSAGSRRSPAADGAGDQPRLRLPTQIRTRRCRPACQADIATPEASRVTRHRSAGSNPRR